MLRLVGIILVCLLASGLGLDAPGLAQPSPAPSPEATATTAATGDVALQYIPPLRGAPGSRIGGGTRGRRASGPVLLVLAPDHPGRSATASPTLYWYLSDPTDKPMEWALNDEQAGTTLAGGPLPPGTTAGIQGLDLAKRGIRLAPGVTYTFFVVIKMYPEEPSRNLVASGQVVHVPPAADANARIGQDRQHAAATYAREGYWYDALAAAMAAGQGTSADQVWALLTQAGLGQVAAARAGKPEPSVP